MVLIKPVNFAWQGEFRIAIGKRDAMNVENVGLTIQTGPAVSAFEPVPAPIFIRINSLADVVTLHRF